MNAIAAEEEVSCVAGAVGEVDSNVMAIFFNTGEALAVMNRYARFIGGAEEHIHQVCPPDPQVPKSSLRSAPGSHVHPSQGAAATERMQVEVRRLCPFGHHLIAES